MASDDDSFQDQDSILYDVTMPYTGTYYLQVKTFVPTDQFNIAEDSGVGRYELFAYSFAATPAAGSAVLPSVVARPPARTPAAMDGDTLIGGSGHDTLIGSSANDLIAIAPGDVVLGGSGADMIDTPALRPRRDRGPARPDRLVRRVERRPCRTPRPGTSRAATARPSRTSRRPTRPAS